MVSVEREDKAKSFIAILRFIDGNTAQEIQVYKWEADAIQAKLQGLSKATVTAMYNLEGKATIKEWN